MTMNPLPPQAYTKDILLKAYSWLMGQSNSIKEMATTPDILVSLYLKATRDGDGALDRPSITNFKNELKSLAGLLGELDKAPSIPSTLPMPNIQESAASPHSLPRESHGTPSFFKHEPSAPSSSQTPPPPVQTHIPLEHSLMLQALNVDAASLALIREVKEDLNLSSDCEALRMIIKVGYTRAKSLLK